MDKCEITVDFVINGADLFVRYCKNENGKYLASTHKKLKVLTFEQAGLRKSIYG